MLENKVADMSGSSLLVPNQQKTNRIARIQHKILKKQYRSNRTQFAATREANLLCFCLVGRSFRLVSMSVEATTALRPHTNPIALQTAKMETSFLTPRCSIQVKFGNQVSPWWYNVHNLIVVDSAGRL